MYKWKIVIGVVLVAFAFSANAQEVFSMKDDEEQHMFSFSEIEYLEDPTGSLVIRDVSTGPIEHQFRPSNHFSPTNTNRNSAYWLRIRIQHNSETKKQWVLEFFDQTMDEVQLFQDSASDFHRVRSLGDVLPFDARPLKHKNFVMPLAQEGGRLVTYYFRIKSAQEANMLIVLREREYFFNYALLEYYLFGIFYGMILVFCLYNLLVFIAVRESQYLFYILYLMSIGLYEMSADGIAFQYLWPNAATWNQYAAGFCLFCASTSTLLFCGSMLNLKERYPKLFNVLLWVFAFRCVFLLVSLFVIKDWFRFRFIEIVPFLAVYCTTLYCWLKGYRAGRLLVVAQSILLFGVLVKVSLYFDINWMPFGEMTHYGLGFCFILEMMFLSFAIHDKIKLLNREKQKASEEVIEQLRVNQKLKDTLNEELEERVKVKTKEVVEKSELIERQNFFLEDANHRLAEQAEEISAMNDLLEHDNVRLKQTVAKVTEARILSKEVDFKEFSEQYPDDIRCLEFLASLKWGADHACRRCQHEHYSEGRSPFSRRCTRCGYDESAIAFTLLQNTHIPVTKAFYMIFLVYSSKGSMSSHKLSEILSIRQSTCWSYNTKIKRAIHDARKKGASKEGDGWSSILIYTSMATKSTLGNG